MSRSRAPASVLSFAYARGPYGPPPVSGVLPWTGVDPNHQPLFELLVEIWYVVIERNAGNTALAGQLGNFSIPNAKVPEIQGTGPDGKPTGEDLKAWLASIASMLKSGKGGGGVGIPDLINKSLHLIYDVKTGKADDYGRSDFPSTTTLVDGWGSVRWYAAWANRSTDSLWNDGDPRPWAPGTTSVDKPLENALAACGGVCRYQIGFGLVILIAYGGPGLIIYKVIGLGMRIRPAPNFQGKYDWWSRFILALLIGLGLGALIGGSGNLRPGPGGGGVRPAPAGGSFSCSFTFDTVVATPQGEKAIGQLIVGEQVLTYNPTTHLLEVQPVEHIWIHVDNDLVDVTIVPINQTHAGTKKENIAELIHATSTHPFLTQEEGFIPASQLWVGMHILQANGGMGVITMIRVVPGSMIMYNLEVAKDHTFMVGEDQWVVHNACKPIP